MIGTGACDMMGACFFLNMRNIGTTILVLVLFIGAGWFFGSKFLTGEKTPFSSTQSSQQETKEGQVTGESFSEPLEFSIPKLRVRAKVEHVGLDSKNAMDIPKNEDNVAWYKLGAKPGEVGNAVIAGHYDKKTGAPAVFYEVGKLKKGDEIKVKGEDGKELIFIVTNTATYKLADFPLQEVFGGSNKVRLNLITCEGVFNSASRLYSHRLVVYSELKN